MNGLSGKNLPESNSTQIEAFKALIDAVLSLRSLNTRDGSEILAGNLREQISSSLRLFPDTLKRKSKIIGLWSRTLNKAERKYSVPESECFGAVYGIKTCRPYLFGENIDVFTDQNCRKWLILIFDPSGRLVR